MKALFKLLILLVAAALVSGCGGSSLSDTSPNKAWLTSVQAGATAPNAVAPASNATAKDASATDAIKEAAANYSALGDPKSKSYKVGPLDVLDITVFKVPDLSKTVQVSEAGTINYPLIGELRAGGRSAREIEQELTQLLRQKYLQKPQITVFVREFNSQRVTVEGAVKKPGVVAMVGGLSLVQAVAQAGGPDEAADSTVVVFRTADGKRAAIRYDMAEIREGGAEDPLLQTGDVVIVPTSNMKQGFNMFVKMLPLATMVSFL